MGRKATAGSGRASFTQTGAWRAVARTKVQCYLSEMPIRL